MNKTELVAAISEKTELTKKDSEKALKALIDVVAEELKKGEKVQLIGFGSFEVRDRAARTGKNPLTGEEMNIFLSAVGGILSVVSGFVIFKKRKAKV